MVELRIVDLGWETGRSAVQLRMSQYHRFQETAARGKRELRKGNNPDYS